MEDPKAGTDRKATLSSVQSAKQTRSLKEPERQYLKAFYARIRRNQNVAGRYVLPTIVIGLSSLAIYALLGENITIIEQLLGGSIVVFVLVFGLYFLRNKVLKETEVKIDDRPLLLLEGPLELRGSSQSMLKLRVEGKRVSIPTPWPKLWYNPVRVWVYPTESGQHLAVDMEYLSEEVREEAAEQYHQRAGGEKGRTHFTLEKELEEGRFEVEKNYYQLY